MRDSFEKVLGRFSLRMVADNYESDLEGGHRRWKGRLPESWRCWLSGRGWLRRETKARDDYGRGKIDIEWVVKPDVRGTIGWGLDLGPTMMSQDDDPTFLGGNVQFLGLKLFLSCQGLIPESLLPGNRIKPETARKPEWAKGRTIYDRTPGRGVGIDFRDGKFWVDLWRRGDGSWSTDDPQWQHIVIDPLELLFGPLHIDSRKKKVNNYSQTHESTPSPY